MDGPTGDNLTRATGTDELLTALRGGDRGRAARALAAVEPPPGAAQLRSLAEGLMRRRRWADAEWLFGQIPNLDCGADPAAAMKRRLCRNLAALERHRPDVYRKVIDAPMGNGDVAIGAAADNLPTILARRSDGTMIGLSPAGRPLAAVAQSFAQLKPVLDRGQAIALCGLGDGYLLAALAQDKRPLFLSQEQPVLLVEPQPQLLLHGLMIHDYTGPAGPIEQPRFRWLIGPGWKAELEASLESDPFAGCPAVTVGQALDAAAIQAKLQSVVAAIGERDARHKAEVETYYATVDRREVAGLFGPNPPRRPRVLLVTTRFSTVLQFATRDAADGFAQNGWDTHVLIEPSPAHRLYRHAIRRVLAEFKPDLVFQIDHLRQEHEDLFPPNLPFACWVQDHLPNLMNEQAGRSVGPTDFLLTDAALTYVNTYAYPRSQLIALSKLTTLPPLRSTADERRGDDLVFVSNASGVPDQLLADVANSVRAGPERDFAASCGRRIIDHYATGGSLDTYVDVCDVVRNVAASWGSSRLLTDDGFHALARKLTHPLNDALYRQQALRWAAAVADELGISLALYGKGWERHPEFARFARGPVAYGEALQDLTRRSRINLQVVPYLCLHQRLLDGIAAGGFFLVRRHPADAAPQALLNLIDKHIGPGARSLKQVQVSMPPPMRERLEALLTQSRPSLCGMGTEDPIEALRDWQEAGLLDAPGGAGMVLPRLEDTSFTNATTLRAAVERFIGNADERQAVVEQQRQSVAKRLTYAAGMRRVAHRIGEILVRTVAVPSQQARFAA